ncbi:MAG: hypothetical protein WDN23_20910 [Edaphobacter sp.]
MKAAVWLRVASVLAFVHGVLHTVGGVFGRVVPGAEQTAVDAMKGNAFVAMGMMRTMWDFYRGMGLAVTILLTLADVVLWQMAVLAKTEMFPLLRTVLGAFVLGFLLMAVVSWQYFFAGPLAAELLIAVCVGMGMVGARVPRGSGVAV